MNSLVGKITAVECDGLLSLVDINVAFGHIATALVVETPARCAYLHVGHSVTVLFKETEVSIAKPHHGGLSLSNLLPARIANIRTDGLLAEVCLDFVGQTVVSIITRRSAQRLQLQVGDRVEWLVKANEISLRGDAHEP